MAHVYGEESNYADGSKNGIYLPTLHTRTNEYRMVSEIPRSTERDQSKACRAGKIVVERAIITGLRPGTVKLKCNNIAKVPNVPALVFPQRPPEDGGGRATLSHGKEDYGPTAHKALVDDRS